MLTGSIVALVTPFTEQGNVDYTALEELVNWHIEQGTDAIVAMGTTGESPTMSHDEHILVVSAVCELAAGRIQVIAGNGSNATAEAVYLTERMAHLPLAGFLNVNPYYNKPSIRGLVEHYRACCSVSDLPQLLYNVPGRTGADLSPEDVAELAEIQNIVGIKEATGDVDRVAELRRLCGSNFILLSGDDPTSCDFLLAGGNGVISVTANVMPAQMKEMVTAACTGQAERAQQIDAEMQAVHEAMFVQANPIPVKWALSCMGKIEPNYRLPMTAPELPQQQHIEQTLKQAGLISAEHE
ncbi:4-hydroxy-tetrahydrodipicolinate synthase [Pseudidiomarina sp. 1APP75-27a]|uniref:4-hydroxy-tetrahydrodipicolinate synthase n=1 Tax=Pseudidiomarina terrestris TaxID=2820060 RepID=UPI002653EE5B|nr:MULTISPECIES: 4-hydroxy-tetrahydrodipicolinate synthase [unclassified Pseudidiomarina]MDN7127173.1 4-hydroxy-tetrahydrodipicolinate synthase [Pseudidiomarina sp. 1APR75-33.1]MEA3586848.1 4-hydroxy-tetrahydrodipicolinate synthase [Pseudidiomarina sp. 1APP75-27a]